MGLGEKVEKKPKTWISLCHGRVEVVLDGKKQYFSYVEGNLHSIYQRKATYGSEAVQKWYIELLDDGGNIYATSFQYNSGTFKSIILALASDKELSSSSLVRLEPYLKGNFTNIVVHSNGEKLDWVTKDLPPIEEATFGGKKFKDESKRMEFISGLVHEINEKLSK